MRNWEFKICHGFFDKRWDEKWLTFTSNSIRTFEYNYYLFKTVKNKAVSPRSLFVTYIEEKINPF